MAHSHSHQLMLNAMRVALVSTVRGKHTIHDFARFVKEHLDEHVTLGREVERTPKLRDTPLVDADLIILGIQPNELLQSWRGRMGSINFLQDAQDVEKALRAWCQERAPEIESDQDFVQCAASALEIARDELLQNHTLTPYFDCLDKLKQNKQGKPGRHLKAYQQHAPLRTGVMKAQFCPKCVDEDLKCRHFSYWRRGHHLPGVICCSTHASPLLVAGDRSCFDHCPEDYLQIYEAECVLPESESAHSILLRYARISEEILASSPKIDSTVASAIIRERVKQAGLRFAKPGKKKTVSTKLMDLLPLSWLMATYPRVHWERDKYISTIDGACAPLVTRYTASTLCLLAAVFYNDADQAITEIVSGSRKKREPFLGFDFWASKEVFDHYCANGGVVKRMAEQMGISDSTVSIGLLNQGLPGLGSKAAPLKNALRLFFKGHSIEESSQLVGVSQEALEDLLRAGGARLSKALNQMANEESDEKLQADTEDKPGSSALKRVDQFTAPE